MTPTRTHTQTQRTRIHNDKHKHTHAHTQKTWTHTGAAARKAGGDGVIDPLVKMGDIPPTSISIKPLRLQASRGLPLFLFEESYEKSIDN